MIRKNILIAIIIVSLVPIFTAVNWERIKFDSSESLLVTSIYIGGVLGLIGAVLLFWQYILGIRFIIGKIFIDYAKANEIHKWIGKYGMILVFIHPAFLFIGYGSAALETLIVPKFETDFDWAINFGKIGLSILLIIWFSSALLRSRMSYDFWKFLHYLSYLILPFVFLHGPSIGRLSLSSDFMNLYWHFMLFVFVIASILRFLFQFGIFQREIRLIKKQKLNEDVSVYTFKYSEEEGKLKFNPGQYFYIQTQFFSDSHPFTVLDFDLNNNEISFGIKTFGNFTSSMEKLIVGDTVWVDGPYGKFTKEAYEKADKDIVLIAGGIGITPFYKILDESQNFQNKITLFNCIRKEEDLIFQELITKSTAKAINIFSDCKPQDLKEIQPNCEFGFISEDILKKYLGNDLTKYRYFICGPDGLMKSVEKILSKNNVNSNQVYLEKFSY